MSTENTHGSEAEIESFMTFYSVSTLQELVLIQARHIERLQEKIPPTQMPITTKTRFA